MIRSPQFPGFLRAQPGCWLADQWLGQLSFFCGESPARGYAWVALIIAVLFIACTAAAIFNVPTTHHANANLHQQKTSLKPMLRVLFLNDQVMSILFISILFNLVLQFNGGVGVYFF